MTKLDLILGTIPNEEFKKIKDNLKAIFLGQLKQVLRRKIGIIFGTPVFYLCQFLVSGFYYSYILPKRLIAQNKLKAKKFNQNVSNHINAFEKSGKIEEFIKNWKGLHEKV